MTIINPTRTPPVNSRRNRRQTAQPTRTEYEERPSLSLQENLLTLMAHNSEFGNMIANLITPSMFENEVHRTLVVRIMDYWKKHKRAPGKTHTPDLVADILEDPNNSRAPAYRAVLTGMVVLTDNGINTDYVMDEVHTFIEMQTIKGTILRAAETMESRQHLAIDDVRQMFAKVVRSHTNTKVFDGGLQLGDIDHLINYLDQRSDHEFTTGIPILDRSNVVPARGTLMALLGTVSAGKSWWLIHLGRQAMRQGKKVLHITLELSQEEVQKRYHQSLWAVARDADDLTTPVTALQLDQEGHLTGLGHDQVTARFSMEDPERAAKLKAAHHNRIGWLNRVVVKQFPTRSLTIPHLRAYLDSLESINGFVPDLLSLDYLGLMKTSAENHRLELGQMVEELRGLASERNLAVVTAQQVNREAQNAKLITRSHIAEDFSIISTADCILILNRTAREQEHKLARLVVDKARHSRDGFGVVMSQNYAHGQFVLNSAWLGSHERYLEMVDNLPARPTDRGGANR